MSKCALEFAHDVTRLVSREFGPPDAPDQIVATYGKRMSDQNLFRAEIEQILRTHTRSHFAKRFLGVERGLTDDQMAEEAKLAGEGVSLERIAYVRQTVRMTLDGERASGQGRANSQAALYRELLNYSMSSELRQHVTTGLTQLQRIDPGITLEPLGEIHLGANNKSTPKRSQPLCKEGNLSPCFCD